MSAFSTLNTAVSGLMAHRRAVELIGHNVANVNTDGYTRRRIDLESAGPGMAAGRWSSGGTYGTGVDIAGVTRIRDAYVDTRLRRELGTSGSADRLAQI